MVVKKVFFIGALFLLSLQANGVLRESTKSLGESKPLVRVGTDAGYEPFTYLDEDSNLVGFEVNLIREMCALLNFNCVFTYKDTLFEDLLPMLENNKVDIVHGGMGITQDRLENFDFLLYYKATKFFFGRKNIVIKKIPDDLSGLTVGAEANTKFVDYVEALSQSLKESGLAPIKIVELKDTDAVRRAHLNGSIDLHPAGQGLIEAWLVSSEFSGFHGTGPELISGFKGEIFGYGDGFAVRNGSPLQYQFREALWMLLHNCRYAELERKYLSFYNGYTPKHCQ